MSDAVAGMGAWERDPDDPRVRRTRTALLRAFNRLFLEHGYEAITPARIAAEAGVGRSTFYEHHAGKEALLRHSVTPLLQPLADAAVGRDAPFLTGALGHFWENRRLAARLLAGRPGRIIRDRWPNSPYTRYRRAAAPPARSRCRCSRRVWPRRSSRWSRHGSAAATLAPPSSWRGH